MSFEDLMTLPVYQEFKEKDNLDEFYRQFFGSFRFAKDEKLKGIIYLLTTISNGNDIHVGCKK